MSESQFIETVVQRFQSNHPPQDGWFVHHVPSTESGPAALLPAFLRSLSPCPTVRERIWTAIGWESRGERRRPSLAGPAGPCRRGGIAERNWFGDMEFLWRGVPIHCRRTVLLHRFAGEFDITLFAARDRAAFADFWSRLRRFSLRAWRGRPSIFVVGEGWLPRPRVGWDELILPRAMLDDIRESAESFFQARSRYRALRLPYRRGMLLCGPPGTGKTLTAKVIAATVRARVLSLPFKNNTGDDDVAQAFRMAQEQSPAVLILEDLDKAADSTRVSMSFLLNLLDGLDTPQGALTIATTNAAEKLDPALLLRPSRFDRVYHYELPGYAERLRLLQLKGLDIFSPDALRRAAEATEGFTMAYVQEIVVSALLRAVHGARAARDEDLSHSLGRLKDQWRTSGRCAGSLPRESDVGFQLPAARQPALDGAGGNGK